MCFLVRRLRGLQIEAAPPLHNIIKQQIILLDYVILKNEVGGLHFYIGKSTLHPE